MVAEGLVNLRHFGRILACVAGAGRDAAVHADARVVGAVPLAPAVVFAGFDVGAVVAAGDVGEGLHAQRAGVVLIGRPGLHEHLVDRADHFGVGADGLARPLGGNLFRR